MHATIDFETYSEAGFIYNKNTKKWEGLLNNTKKGLPGVGMAVYAKHPSTDILSLAFKLPDEDVRIWTPNDDGYIPSALERWVEDENLIEAFNVGFERWIWEEVAVKKYGFPPVAPHTWRCAAAKSRAFALPGHLGDVAKVLNTTAQKNKEGKRLITKFSCPRNPTAKDSRLRILPKDDPKDAQLLYTYNVDDVKAELEISARVPELSEFELKFWQCDQEINHRGVQLDIVSVLNCIRIIEQANKKYNDEVPILTNGAVNKTTEIARIRRWMESLGVVVPSLNEESIIELLKNPLLLPQIRRVLEIRQLIGSSAVKKLYAMLNQCTASGRLHDLFIYHSARTGRAAGSGVQPQNLPRGQEDFDVDAALNIISNCNLDEVEFTYGNATTAVSNCLRGLFIAKPGYNLISSDYSAIEAVVLAELAGESWRQEVFRTHGKIYEMSASLISGIPFEEILEHKEKTGKHHPIRKLGKVAELASGYGGWMGAWLNFGADEFLSEDEIKKSILSWRAASPAIVEFWGGQIRRVSYAGENKDMKSESYYNWLHTPEYYGVEGAAIQAVLYPGTRYHVSTNISFICTDTILYCMLPSGRELTYHRPLLELSSKRPGTYELSFEGWNTNPKGGAPGWIRQTTYSGKLVENIVQAVARDILAYAIVNLETFGYPIVLHVHDEIVSEVLQKYGSIEEFERIMSKMPAWADGWPVVARGGWRGKRYRK